MPETKPDKRFTIQKGFIFVGFIVAALVGAGLCVAAAELHSTALWIAVGVLIGCAALGGICYSVWIFRYYRCPQCHCRLRPEPGPRTRPLRIRYHCKHCDAIWDSGITWGGE